MGKQLKNNVINIEIKPSPTGYAKSLILLVEIGDAKGRAWACQEIIKFIKAAATLNPDAWAKEE